MNNRDEAVKYFKTLGYRAFIRDWVLGQTVGVPIGKRHHHKINDHEFDSWDGVLYLYPTKADEWAISDSRDVWTDRDKKYPSLQEAVLVAEKIVRELDTDMEN